MYRSVGDLGSCIIEKFFLPHHHGRGLNQNYVQSSHLAGNSTHECPRSRLLSSWEESFAGLVTIVNVHRLLCFVSILNVVTLFPLSRMECLHAGGSR